MIFKEQLKEYAKLKNYNLGQAEKDYFQEIILFVLYQEFGTELIFKGGTALTKCYGFNRFSEDLDFTSILKKDLKSVISKGLKRYFLDFDNELKTTQNSLKLIYRIKGPLYNGNKNSFCKISLDISFREKVILPPLIKTIGLHIEEIPSFNIPVMSEKEIFAEKIRAIITRNKARDLYDLYYLIKRNIKQDIKLINEKLKYYSLNFIKSDFKKNILLKENIWYNELSYLVISVPKFNEVKKSVFDLFQIK